jgi:uncharacterized protein (DUF1501 family)
MNDSHNTFDRRSLLVGGVTIFGGMSLLGRHALARQSGAIPKDGAPPRTLLLVELNGGNDGLSCVVPHGDDIYFKSRTRVGVKKSDVLTIDDYRGFHPNMSQLRHSYGDGRIAIIEGAGYPNPNHSHFTSQDIWHTARAAGRASGDGWIGRLLAAMYANDTQVPHAVHVGQTMPYSLKSATHPVVCFDEPPAYRWAANAEAIAESGGGKGAKADNHSPLSQIRSVVRNAQQSSLEVRRSVATYKPRAEYCADTFSQDLKVAAALLQNQIGCRVMSVAHQGYDTHEDQKRRHDALMGELDRGLTSFIEDTRGTPAGDNVVVLVFSEFGRRVEDNASIGTDHGTAGPMFMLGTPVKGGLYGKHPSLANLVEGDLIHTTDFRSVYASVIQNWFGVDSVPILGDKYAPIEGVLA